MEGQGDLVSVRVTALGQRPDNDPSGLTTSTWPPKVGGSEGLLGHFPE